MELESVIPWGRNKSEYMAMFALSERDLAMKVIGVGDGPASFNAECQLNGWQITSVDPLYQFTAEQIAQRVDAAYPRVLEEVTKHRGDFVWNDISDPDMLGELRMQAMQIFLRDYQQQGAHKRYINAALPTLPFSYKQFDLALCSHLLFLYSEHLDLTFHLEACRELCRVAQEVRIYPLVTLDNSVSLFIKPVIESVRFLGMEASLVPVRYEFQRGATEMLVIRNRQDNAAA